MKQWFNRLLCSLLGCYQTSSRRSLSIESRSWQVKKGRNRRWGHARNEHRAKCARCGRWSRWIRHKHFDSWLERQQR